MLLFAFDDGSGVLHGLEGGNDSTLEQSEAVLAGLLLATRTMFDLLRDLTDC